MFYFCLSLLDRLWLFGFVNSCCTGIAATMLKKPQHQALVSIYWDLFFKKGKCWAPGHSAIGTTQALCIIPFCCLSPGEFSLSGVIGEKQHCNESVSTDFNYPRHGSLEEEEVGSQDVEGLGLLLITVQLASPNGSGADSVFQLHFQGVYPDVRLCFYGGKGAFS